MEFGPHHCQTDHYRSVFHLLTSAGYILLVVCVDDIVITGDDSSCNAPTLLNERQK